MIRLYDIKWHLAKEERCGKAPVNRTTMVKLTDAKGEVAVDAKRALNIFIKSCGNLKKNVVTEIIEMDEDGVQIGEKITPTGDSIIPTRK